jgi:hypothetical protein
VSTPREARSTAGRDRTAASTARRRRGLVLWALAVVQAGSACYRVVPVAGVDRATAGGRFVAALTSQGTTDMAAQVGPDVVRLEGVLLGTRGDSLELALIRTEKSSGTDDLWQRQRIVVPRTALASMGERRIDRKRSWLAAAGVGALAFLAAAITGGAGGGGDGLPQISPPG